MMVTHNGVGLMEISTTNTIVMRITFFFGRESIDPVYLQILTIYNGIHLQFVFIVLFSLLRYITSNMNAEKTKYY